MISFPLPYLYAVGEIGVKEVAGDGDNPRIREYHGATKAGPSPDAIFWCASFVNWCLKQAGITGTRTRRAKDFAEKLPLGFKIVPTKEARVGDIMVLDRGAAGGHVTFYAGPAGQFAFYGLGGNQADEVNVGRYPLRRVEAVVRYA